MTTAEKAPLFLEMPLTFDETDTVILPNLRVGWASTPIKLNPHYSVVAPEAEEWFKEYDRPLQISQIYVAEKYSSIFKHDERTHRKFLKVDYGSFAGFCAP